MKKISTITSILFAATSIFAANLEDGIKPLKDTEASQWFLDSWQEGYVYEQVASYGIESSIKLDYKSTKDKDFLTKLCSAAKAGVAEVLKDGGSVKGYFNGDAIARSYVLSNDKDLRILRFYPEVDSNRILFLDTQTDFGLSQSTWDYMNDKSGVKKFITNGIDAGLLGIGATTSVIDPSQASTLTIIPFMHRLASGVGEKAQDMFDKFVKDNKITKTDNGFRISHDSNLFKLFIGDNNGNVSKLGDFGDLAVAIQNEFNMTGYYIQTNQKAKELSDLKKIKSSKYYKKMENSLYEIKENKEKGLVILSENLKSLEEPTDIAKGLIQRETFALNKEIFDAKERKEGDSWVVSADFLNTFLHTDLSGKIEGRLALEYADDTVIDGKFKGERLNVRMINIISKAQDSGKNVNTQLKYVEEGFSADWNAGSQGQIFVDKKTGVVVSAILDFRIASESPLPKTALTDGFVGVGDTVLKIKYKCYPSKEAE